MAHQPPQDERSIEPPVPESAPGSEYAGALSFVGAGVGIRLVSNTVGVVAGAATVALALRMLGPVSYGRLAFALAVVALVTALGRLGFGLGTAQTIAAAAGDAQTLNRTARGALTISFLTGTTSALVVVALTVFGPFGTDTSTRLVVGAGLGVLLLGNNLTWAVFSIARGLGRIATMEILGLTVTLGQLIALIVLRVAGVTDLRAVAVGFGVAGLGGAVASAWVARRLFPDARGLFLPAPAAARTLLRLLLPFALAGIAIQLIAQFDVFVLGLFRSKPEVAQYQPTLKLVDGLLQLVPFLVIGSFVPAATRLVRRGDREGFRDLYRIASKFGYVVAFPAILGLAVFPEVLLHALYGPRFPARPGLVWMFLVGYVVNLAFGLNVAALVSAGDRRRLVQVNLAGLVTMVVIALGLIPLVGPMGGAVATTASYLVWNAAASTALFRSTGVHPFRADLVVTVASSFAVLAAGAAARVWLRPHGLLPSLALTAALWLGWLALLMAVRAVRRAELSPLSLFAGRGARRAFLAEPD